MVKFRFQDLEIWKMAIEIADELFEIADDLEEKSLFRFADQLRGAGMGMSNNIAEGSGSSSNKVFHRYLDIAKSSTFENANITILLGMSSLIGPEKKNDILEKLDHLCRKISNFQRTLKN